MMSNSSQETVVEGIYFSWVHANGANHRIASTIPNLIPQQETPNHRQQPITTAAATTTTTTTTTTPTPAGERQYLILFLHGWPESWYSWRHQLLFLKDCGCHSSYLAVAPDMRGYGSTTTRSPPVLEDFTQPALAKDVVGIANALGYHDKFIVVGHDWGAQLAWTVALLYPKRILGVCAMSVPYAGTPKASFLTMLQAKYGKCLLSNNNNGSSSRTPSREERESAKFHYMLHHCLPRAGEEYDQNCREFLTRIYGYHPGCSVEPGTPELDPHGLMFPSSGDVEHDRSRVLDATAAPGLWCRIPRPTKLPPWMTQQDLDYYVVEYQRAGFAGGLLWYEALDLNFQLMKHALRRNDGTYDDKIRPKALFITGDEDGVIRLYGGMRTMLTKLKAAVPHMIQEPIIINGCGHWIQQESPNIVNEALLKFFDQVVSNGHPGSTPQIHSQFPSKL